MPVAGGYVGPLTASNSSGGLVFGNTATVTTTANTTPFYIQPGAIQQQQWQQNPVYQQYQPGGMTVDPAYIQNLLMQLQAAQHPDHAESIVRGAGHMVLKKIRIRVLPAPPKLQLVGPETPLKPLEIRDIDGLALPVAQADYVMPDGSVIRVAADGNYKIEDREAKVTYKANRTREFNPYINASDLLEDFIAAIGRHPLVTQGNILKLPVEAFINWLIREAALKDGDSTENLPTVDQALAALPAPVAA